MTLASLAAQYRLASEPCQAWLSPSSASEPASQTVHYFTDIFPFISYVDIDTHTHIQMYMYIYTHKHTYIHIFKRYYLFLERGKEREKERENHWCARDTSMSCLLHDPTWVPGPQPRHVSRLGIEPVTFHFPGWHSIHWATHQQGHIYKILQCVHIHCWGSGQDTPRYAITA